MGPMVEEAPGDPHGEVHAVAVVAHGLDLDVAEAARIRHRRPRHPGEDDRPHHVHVAQAALEPPHQRQGEVVDPVGDAAGVHQAPGHDEEGDGQQGKRVDAADHPVQDHQVGLHPLQHDVDERGAREGDGHRHPDDQEEQETADERECDHWCRPSSRTLRSGLDPVRQFFSATWIERKVMRARPSVQIP